MDKKALDTALTQVGVKETGYNRGGKVSEYIKRGGGKDGLSWCMYFVYWCYDSVARLLKVKNPLKRTGSCADQLRFANSMFSGLKVIRTNSLLKVEDVKPGSIAIFKSGKIYTNDIGTLWNGHTGLIINRVNDNTFRLVEGNTNAKGSREGNAVAIKQRGLTSNSLNMIGIIAI